MKTLAFTDPSLALLRGLANYVPPENTLARPEDTWNTARSTFYRVHLSGWVSQEACERRHPEELEFRREYCPDMTPEIHDAIRDAATDGVVSKLLGEDPAAAVALAVAFGVTATFRLSTITTRRGQWDVAFVRNGTFHVL